MNDDTRAAGASVGALIAALKLADVNLIFAIGCGVCGLVIGVPRAVHAFRSSWLPFLRKVFR